jgi:Tol biopolymer transport system component
MQRGTWLAALVTTIGMAPAAMGTPAQAAFPGENGRIVFDSAFARGGSQLYSILPDGRGLRQITHVPEGVHASEPRVSPGGRRIAYVSDESGSPQIWVIGTNGSDPHQITDDPGREHVGPAWSPDGRHIVYSRCGLQFGFYFTCRIVVIRANGTHPQVLVPGRWDHTQPVWSPDGGTIAFVSDKGGYDARLWLVDADGSNLRTIGPTTGVERLSWSPDSTRIAFTGDFRCGGIYTIDVAGTDLQPVVTCPDGGIFPSWSPDGSFIAALTEHDETCGCPALQRIAVADASRVTLVTSEAVPGLAFSDWGVAP